MPCGRNRGEAMTERQHHDGPGLTALMVAFFEQGRLSC